MIGMLPACCSPGPEGHASDEPAEERPSDDDGDLPRTGCRYSERLLGQDEIVDGWPSPVALAAAVGHEYLGSVTWHEDSEGGAEEILLRVEVDPTRVKLRYPTALPRPGEPRLCIATPIFPVRVRIMLGGAEAEVQGNYVAFNRLLELSGDLDSSFASSFGTEHPENYRVFIDVSLDGSVAAGKFELFKRGVIRRVEAVFIGHRKTTPREIR